MRSHESWTFATPRAAEEPLRKWPRSESSLRFSADLWRVSEYGLVLGKCMGDGMREGTERGRDEIG